MGIREILFGSRTKKVEEAFGVPEEPKPIKEGKVIVSRVKQSTGVRPSSSFRNQVKVFNKDALVRQAAVRQAGEIVGGGFFTVVDENYSVSLPKPPAGEDDKSEEDWTAKEAIDYFNESNDLDAILQTVAIEMVAYGNSFVSIKDGLRLIPIDSIEKAVKRTKNTPVEKEYNLVLTATYGGIELRWGEFIHFRSNMTSSSAPFGTGIIAGLMKAYDVNVENAPTPLDLRHSTRKSMEMGFKKFSFGNELWIFEELADDKIDDVNDLISEMEETGERIVSNKRGDIKIAVPQRTTSYDQWLKATRQEFNSLLEDPALMSREETLFAKATIEGEIKLYRKKILTNQRILKRQVELLWKKCLTEWGFDAEKAKPRLNFGMEAIPKMEFKDIKEAYDSKLISREEARKMLIEARWKLEENTEFPEEPEPAVQEHKLEINAVDPQLRGEMSKLTQTVAKETSKTSKELETIKKNMVELDKTRKSEMNQLETKTSKSIESVTNKLSSSTESLSDKLNKIQVSLKEKKSKKESKPSEIELKRKELLKKIEEKIEAIE